MAPRSSLRTALRLLGLAACLGAAAPRPAQACYCVEHTSCSSIDVTPPAPAEAGESPAPNTYVVEVTWAQYVDTCTYEVEGTPSELEAWTQESFCTVVKEEATDTGYWTGTARCLVIATERYPEAEPYGSFWTFQVTGGDASSCSTEVFLPAPLEAPAEGDAVRDGSGEVTLSWEAPAPRLDGDESALPILRYDVYRAAAAAGLVAAGAPVKVGTTTTTSFTDAGLTSTDAYRYEIYPVDAYGQGEALVVELGAGVAPGAVTAGGCSSAGSLGPPRPAAPGRRRAPAPAPGAVAAAPQRRQPRPGWRPPRHFAYLLAHALPPPGARRAARAVAGRRLPDPRLLRGDSSRLEVDLAAARLPRRLAPGRLGQHERGHRQADGRDHGALRRARRPPAGHGASTPRRASSPTSSPPTRATTRRSRSRPAPRCATCWASSASAPTTWWWWWTTSGARSASSPTPTCATATSTRPVGSFMSSRMVTIRVGTPNREAFLLMEEQRVKAAPVLDADGRLAGVLTRDDAVRLELLAAGARPARAG